MNRMCKKCGLEKDILLFVKKRRKDGFEYYLYTCIDCNKQYTRNYCKDYYALHKTEIIENSKDWYKNNTDRKKDYDANYMQQHKIEKKEYDANYREINKDKINNRIYNYRKNRRLVDPTYRLRKSISYSVWYYLNMNNSSKGNKSVLDFLPYTINELKEYLEKQFKTWMNWNNYGMYHINNWDDDDQNTWKWNIDHIIPQSKLPYTSMEDDNFKKCWELVNLRPLSAKENLLKGDKS